MTRWHQYAHKPPYATLDEFGSNHHPDFLRQKKALNWGVILTGDNDSEQTEAIYKSNEHNLQKRPVRTNPAERDTVSYPWQYANAAVGQEQVVTMAAEHQKAFFSRTGAVHQPGKIIFQPSGGGSLVAAYIALAYIMVKDPHAQVMIMPDNHIISPQPRFAEFARQCLQLASAYPERVFLAGALPNRCCGGYDWIARQPDNLSNRISNDKTGGVAKSADFPGNKSIPFQTISRIHNKPRANRAEKLYTEGALWNTGIVIAKAGLLWDLLSRQLPVLFERVAYTRSVIAHFGNAEPAADYIDMAISHAFFEMPAYDFSHEICRPLTGEFMVIPLQGITWETTKANKKYTDRQPMAKRNDRKPSLSEVY